MIINAIIIVMLNFIVMGAVLLLDFTAFSKIANVSDAPSDNTLPGLKQTEVIRMKRDPSFKKAA